jgi:hypothetical protein
MFLFSQEYEELRGYRRNARRAHDATMDHDNEAFDEDFVREDDSVALERAEFQLAE